MELFTLIINGNGLLKSDNRLIKFSLKQIGITQIIMDIIKIWIQIKRLFIKVNGLAVLSK